MEEYSKTYYASLNKEESDQAKMLAKILTKLYNPKSVVDIGCGTGLYLAPFNIEIKYGVDISAVAFDPELKKESSRNLIVKDLTKPKAIPLKTDLAICLEVVEHVGDENVEVLMDNIVSASDILVVTSAPPGQAGLNHVNCQPQEYWQKKFEARGFHRDYHDEYQIVSYLMGVPHTVWIIRNLMVYKKNES